MKKCICIFIALLTVLTLFGCASGGDGQRKQTSYNGKTVNDILSGATGEAGGNGKTNTPTGKTTKSDIKCDIDLTVMSSTMVYTEVYNMMVAPEDYLGKTVRMSGNFAYAKGDGRYYFACIVADATACCSQGIEFVLADARKFPDEYPQVSDTITVVGTFDTYYEGSDRYCQLINAVLE